MGPNTCLTGQGGCLWQYVFAPYPSHSIHGLRNHDKTRSRFTASAYPGQMALTRGKDGYVTWRHQSTQGLHQRAAQGLETPTWSSSSYLAMHPGSRSPSNLLTLASTRHGNTLRIENIGSTSWKSLCSSSGLARDDDADCCWFDWSQLWIIFHEHRTVSHQYVPCVLLTLDVVWM